MARLIDSLFLFGRGTGVTTCGDFACDICKTKYNEGNDANEDYDGDSEPYDNFAGLTVCVDCYERIEDSIIERMPQILAWYKKYYIDEKLKIKNQVEELLT